MKIVILIIIVLYLIFLGCNMETNIAPVAFTEYIHAYHSAKHELNNPA